MIAFKCDRCGTECQKGSLTVETVEIDSWQQNGGEIAEALQVRVVVGQPSRDFDEPDLCQCCRLEVIQAVTVRLVVKLRELRRQAVEIVANASPAGPV